MRCGGNGIGRVAVEPAGRIEPTLALKRRDGFSVIVAVVAVDPSGRETGAVEQYFSLNNKRGIVLSPLPNLRLFDRLSVE